MNLDARIKTKTRPQFGCHSELDRLSQREPFKCSFMTSATEKACEGCSRRNQPEGSENGIS